MPLEILLSAGGLLLTAAGSALLYAASENQRLLRIAPSRRLLVVLAAVLILLGTAAWVSTWGGLVGGLLALLTWMLVSVALPYVAARRGIR
ncbi:hypothetical protein [Thauera sinica]|uniref:Uncharacterized protein n=1 Tax=Thauera sinica TaxID=2665146 RepID=A0ABW1AX99_9RHOO|nr:hypothetical protein [Thauera sp. K11]ATE61810.1 hypothetical protein CCZ27_19220 [Thauera sp. K11]